MPRKFIGRSRPTRRRDADGLVQRLDTMHIVNEPEPEPEPKLNPDSEDSEADAETPRHPTFRFFDLPYELRLRVYELLLVHHTTLDLDPTNARTLAPSLRLFRVSHRTHAETARVFYSLNTFRVLPIHGKYINKKHPLLAWIPRKYKQYITRLELRLGPGFTRPPKGWVMDARHGFGALGRVHLVKVFVEIDPEGSEMTQAFMTGAKVYTEFCVGLLRALLAQVGSVRTVEFDAYPSVGKGSKLLKALVEESRLNQKRVKWGTERGWDNIVDTDLAGVMGKLGI